MVRDFLAIVTSDGWPRRARTRATPDHQESTLSCLHVILEEELDTTATPYATGSRQTVSPIPTHLR